MIIDRYPTREDPNYAWLGLRFRCPACDTRVRFEISDLTSLPKIYPRQVRGQWVVMRACPVCAGTQHFVEVRPVEHTPLSVDPDEYPVN
jgi:hypothetical protein